MFEENEGRDEEEEVEDVEAEDPDGGHGVAVVGREGVDADQTFESPCQGGGKGR